MIASPLRLGGIFAFKYRLLRINCQAAQRHAARTKQDL
jgi:hypothetical protein